MRETAAAMTAMMSGRKALRQRWRKAHVSSRGVSVELWKEFLQSSFRFGHDLRRATATVSRIAALLKALDLKPQSLVALPDATIAEFREVLRKAQFSPKECEGLIGRVNIPVKGVSFTNAAAILARYDEAFSHGMDRKLKRVASSKDADETIGRATGYLGPEDPEDAGAADDTRCVVAIEGVPVLEDVPKELCIVVAIVLFIVLIGIGIASLIEEAETDEGPRALFNSEPCSRLNSRPISELVVMIEALSRGPTLDGDEQAILRLFGCLSCGRLAEIWNSDSIHDLGEGRISSRLLYDFDGDEFDRLKVRLQECGIMRFSDFDDDATRIFINSNNCTVLSRLSIDDLRQLILNLFEGSTGDDDEAAIIKLIECLPLYAVNQLMSLPGMSFDDFDDEVDGAEWTRLRRTLEAATRVWA